MGEPWIRKYQPTKSVDVPQPEAVAKLKQFFDNFKVSKKKSVLIHGPTGTCKTCAVYALAEEQNLEVIEVNASDVRKADALKSRVGSAVNQMSLFGGGKVILIDEVDRLSGVKDRGGAPELAKIIEKSSFPVVLTANDPWDKKLSTLRKKAELIEFPIVENNEIANVLKNICDDQGIEADETSLKSLARRSAGDLRAAVNDLQSIMLDKKLLTREMIDSLGDRDREESMNNALTKIFKSSDPSIAISAFNNVNEDLDQCFLWVDESLPKEYKSAKDRARAYDALSRADVYRGRIRRRQHWRFLSYVNTLLSAGVAVAKDEKYVGVVKYEQTKRLLKIWQANMKYQKRKAIASKIAVVTHTSSKQTIKHLPYLQKLFQHNHPSVKAIAEQCDLDPEEVEWLSRK
jgi:replication factor C large subunit